MARIVVVGGSGFLGSRVVAGLRQAGAQVFVASRNSEVKVDATKPETFAALAPYEVVVDLSDTVSHRPDALIAWCLGRGKCVIEATSEAPCVERLHAANVATKGRLVLGGGIFTGVSNVLARDVAQRVGVLQALTLGVASSPFSGSGAGTIALMVSALEVPAVRYEGGKRIEEPKVRRGPALDFGGVKRPTGYMSLAEPFMLQRSTGAPKVDVLFCGEAGDPGAGVHGAPPVAGAAEVVPGAGARLLHGAPPAAAPRVASAVDLVASAHGSGGEVRRWVKAGDGMAAAGYALAAMTEAIAAKQDWEGVRFIDDVTDLEAIVARANALAGTEVLTVSEPLTGTGVPATTRAA